VPMMNPDGVTLVRTKANATAATKLLNNGSVNYNRWKANIRGVDLNRNFDGGWITRASTKYASYKNYKGTKAFSEPESRALRDFVAKHQFKSYISYHSSGSVLNIGIAFGRKIKQ
ncbi:peptidase M14, partial [Butyricicoccus sp. 1XD8-22]